MGGPLEHVEVGEVELDAHRMYVPLHGSGQHPAVRELRNDAHEVDRFRIKIWELATEAVVSDNTS